MDQDGGTEFEIIGPLTNVETVAVGSSIREVPRLRRTYGAGRWRKRKGITRVRFADGTVAKVEVHLVRSPRHRPQGTEDQALPG